MQQAQDALLIYQQIPLQFVEVNLERAIELSHHLDIYAYDAYLIACALTENCSLLTLAGGLSYAAKAAGVQVLEVKQ